MYAFNILRHTPTPPHCEFERQRSQGRSCARARSPPNQHTNTCAHQRLSASPHAKTSVESNPRTTQQTKAPLTPNHHLTFFIHPFGAFAHLHHHLLGFVNFTVTTLLPSSLPHLLHLHNSHYFRREHTHTHTQQRLIFSRSRLLGAHTHIYPRTFPSLGQHIINTMSRAYDGTARAPLAPMQARSSPNHQQVRVPAPLKTTMAPPSTTSHRVPSPGPAGTTTSRPRSGTSSASSRTPQPPAQSQPRPTQQRDRAKGRLATEKPRDHKDPASIGPWKLDRLIGQGASGE